MPPRSRLGVKVGPRVAVALLVTLTCATIPHVASARPKTATAAVKQRLPRKGLTPAKGSTPQKPPAVLKTGAGRSGAQGPAGPKWVPPVRGASPEKGPETKGSPSSRTASPAAKGTSPAKAPAAAKSSAAAKGSSAANGPAPSPQPASSKARKPDGPVAKKGGPSDDVPPAPADDRDRERVRRLQETIGEILQNRTLGRLRIGLRVVSAKSGRLLYGRSADVLMDPASNQKVLATTAALMRLGGDWRFRTELSGPEADGDGVLSGPVYLRGNGDPSLRMADLENLASRLRGRGITRIDGGIIADPRRLGDDGPAPGRTDGDDVRAPLLVDRGITVVRVRPGETAGAPAIVLTYPGQPAGAGDDRQGFLIRNQAVTKAELRRAKVSVKVGLADGRLRVDVSGKIPLGSAGVAFRRRVPHPALHAAVLLRAALVGAGIAVRDPASTGLEKGTPAFVVTYQSAPLQVVLRKINKDSDNDQAERVLQAVGAEQRGGAATTEKGLSVLREVIGSVGLRPSAYVPKNGSGLGHANRITAHAMADLLRALYFDPRVGPEILQSLSVGGVDGTTRNRFKGTLAARRVRAKTGTLNGKSCLSGLVGDGDDVMVFAMMVQGFRGRQLSAVRAAQVGAVTALMRYVREGTGERIDLPPGFEERDVGRDVETGGEAWESGQEGEGEAAAPDIMPPAGEAPPRLTPGQDAVDHFLRQSRGGGGAPDPATTPPPAPPATGGGTASGTAAASGKGAASGTGGGAAPASAAANHPAAPTLSGTAAGAGGLRPSPTR